VFHDPFCQLILIPTMFFCYYADHSDSSGVGEAGSGEARNPWRNHDAQARWFELSHN
jgi:hypothetical protein